MSPFGNSKNTPQLPNAFPLSKALQIHLRDGDKNEFVLEDSARGKFFRIGKVESSFIQALIETESATLAYQRINQVDNELLSIDKAIQLCKWMAVNGLTRSLGSNPASGIPPKENSSPSFLLSVFSWQLPLINPDRWLGWLTQSMGWMCSPKAMVVGLICFVASLLQTTGHWSEFTASYENLFSSWRWLSLTIAWCLLKVVHETAHGVTCRRYGGEVNEAGFAFILLMPIPYINVTSSWRFPSRWQRLHVTLAGVASELFIAGVALISWNMFESLPLKQAAADVVLLASVSTILFNLNPLLKFDGYFALADMTGVDNLHSFGQRYARYFGGRYILGLYLEPPVLPSSRLGWIKLYGLSSAVYRVSTTCGLLAAAASIFQGAGIIVAIAGAISFIGKPLVALVQWLYKIWKAGELRLGVLSLRLACLGSVAIAPLWVIPVEWSWTAPAVIEFDPPAVLRTRSSGFVNVIHVRDGDSVISGQPIVSLHSDVLEISLLELKKQIAQVQREIRAARWQRKSSELNDALTRESGLRDQILELQTNVDELVLRAPCDGTVISRRLALIPGAYIKEGEELAVIGREKSKRLKLSISQREAKQVDEWMSHPLRIIVDGCNTWTSYLTRVEMRAESTPPDESLIAINGGSLAAIRQGTEKFILCEPRVNAYVSLTPEQSLPLRCGQRASVRLNSDRQSIAQWTIAFVAQRLSSMML